MAHRNERRPSVFSIKEELNDSNRPIHSSTASSTHTTAETAASITVENQVLATLLPDDNDHLSIPHTCYLSSLANILDLISIIAYWTDILLLILSKKQPPSILQALASIRLLRFLVMTEGTNVIMKSLRWSYEMLKNVMGFFVFFLLLFSLVALFVFMNAFNRRCAMMPTTPLQKNMSGNNT